MSELRLISRPGVEDITGITEFIDGDFVEKDLPNGGKMRYTYYVPVPEEPEDTTPPSIRKITKRSFMRRLDITERIAIRNSTNDLVIDIHEDILTASNVDLDLQDTFDALTYLSLQGLLSVHTEPELLADGTIDEEYRGI